MATAFAGRPAPADHAFRWIAIGSAAIVLVVLGLIAAVMTARSIPALRAMGFEFFVSRRWSPANNVYGALPFMWGTLYTSLIAIAIAGPVSVGVALFITEVAPRWMTRPLVHVIDLLAVVPSVVFGLWGILVLAPTLGRCVLTAGLILGMMVTPLVGAVMLGLGRAMGETIAVALTIGSAIGQISINPLKSGNSMPAAIANQWGEAFDLQKSALIALAVLLFAITIAVNLAATAIVLRSRKRSSR
jgi:phosphate transport system permease protein